MAISVVAVYRLILVSSLGLTLNLPSNSLCPANFECGLLADLAQDLCFHEDAYAGHSGAAAGVEIVAAAAAPFGCIRVVVGYTAPGATFEHNLVDVTGIAARASDKHMLVLSPVHTLVDAFGKLASLPADIIVAGIAAADGKAVVADAERAGNVVAAVG